MAYNIHWKIKFKSLRAGTDYTVNIYKDGTLPSGYPLTLTGGASTFITEEDSNNDPFTPIRKQSGYIRIVDDGKAKNASDASVAFNWRDILPMNDTDRPVTLTDGSNNVLWYGFMQAQNFGGTLYGGTQEREYPIQCPLSITQGNDINVNQTNIQNFAYLLKAVVDSIPTICQPTTFIVQGGGYAIHWLRKRIDWQNFVQVDSKEELTARYSMYQCLEDMCRFWGWTARMKGNTLYLTCADDADHDFAWIMTSAQLAQMAQDNIAGDDDTMFSTVALSGDIFAGFGNDDNQLRGANKATITSNCNKAEDRIISFAPSGVDTYLKQQTPTTVYYDNIAVKFYGDLETFPSSSPAIPSPLLTGTCTSGKASFSYISSNAMQGDAIRIKKTYNGSWYAAFETTFEHSFVPSSDNSGLDIGGFMLHGNIYQKAERYNDYYPEQDAMNYIPAFRGCGQKAMYIRFGVGKTRETARWFNGTGWQDTATTFLVSIGNEDDILRPIIRGSGSLGVAWHINIRNEKLEGRVFVDFFGSDDMPVVSGERQFYIMDFNVEFSRTKNYYNTGDNNQLISGNTTMEYVNKNNVSTSIQENIDLGFASDNKMEAGYGILLNPDKTAMETAVYANATEHPEQHLANRITNYWSSARRMIGAEFRSNLIADINPRNKVTLDGTTTYPIAISRDWRDDITRLTLLEV